jgi:hypothetical protein
MKQVLIDSALRGLKPGEQIAVARLPGMRRVCWELNVATIANAPFDRAGALDSITSKAEKRPIESWPRLSIDRDSDSHQRCPRGVHVGIRKTVRTLLRSVRVDR